MTVFRLRLRTIKPYAGDFSHRESTNVSLNSLKRYANTESQVPTYGEIRAMGIKARWIVRQSGQPLGRDLKRQEYVGRI